MIQGYVHRAVQGRLRASADSLGNQFSPDCTISHDDYEVNLSTTYRGESGNVTQHVERSFRIAEDQQIDPFAAERAEL